MLEIESANIIGQQILKNSQDFSLGTSENRSLIRTLVAMERHKVSSSRLSEVAYDKERSELWVLYKSGEQFLFSEVPHSFYLEMMLAGSIGKYYFDNIRESFPHRRQPAPRPSSEEE